MVHREKARVTATTVPRPLGFRRERLQALVRAARSLSGIVGGPRVGSTEPFVSVPTIPGRLLEAFFKPSEHVAEGSWEPRHRRWRPPA